MQHSKREMEMAAKLIDKLHEERKQMKQRIKNKNAVVMQQEQQIQQRQEHVEEASRAVQEMRREMDRKNQEVKELEGEVQIGRAKLEEA